MYQQNTTATQTEETRKQKIREPTDATLHTKKYQFVSERHSTALMPRKTKIRSATICGILLDDFTCASLKVHSTHSNCLNCNIRMNLYFMRTYGPYNCPLKEEDVIKIDINFSQSSSTSNSSGLSTVTAFCAGSSHIFDHGMEFSQISKIVWLKFKI